LRGGAGRVASTGWAADRESPRRSIRPKLRTTCTRTRFKRRRALLRHCCRSDRPVAPLRAAPRR